MYIIIFTLLLVYIDLKLRYTVTNTLLTSDISQTGDDERGILLYIYIIHYIGITINIFYFHLNNT